MVVEALPSASTDGRCCDCHIQHEERNLRGRKQLSCWDSGTNTWLWGCRCKGRCTVGHCGLRLCLFGQFPLRWEPASLGGSEEPAERCLPVVQMGSSAPIPYMSLCLPGWNLGRLMRLGVLADGRCPFASVLLALGLVPLHHGDEFSKALIDGSRRAVGGRLSIWSEQRWQNEVPNELRSNHIALRSTETPCGADPRGTKEVLTDILLHHSPTEHLDLCVFYPACDLYDIGIVVIQMTFYLCNTDGTPSSAPFDVRYFCMGRERQRHVVILSYNRSGVGHYECIRFDGQTVFPSDSPLMQTLWLLHDTARLTEEPHMPQDWEDADSTQNATPLHCAADKAVSTRSDLLDRISAEPRPCDSSASGLPPAEQATSPMAGADDILHIPRLSQDPPPNLHPPRRSDRLVEAGHFQGIPLSQYEKKQQLPMLQQIEQRKLREDRNIRRALSSGNSPYPSIPSSIPDDDTGVFGTQHTDQRADLSSPLSTTAANHMGNSGESDTQHSAVLPPSTPPPTATLVSSARPVRRHDSTPSRPARRSFSNRPPSYSSTWRPSFPTASQHVGVSTRTPFCERECGNSQGSEADRRLPTPEEIANHPRLLTSVPFASRDTFLRTVRGLFTKYAEASMGQVAEGQHRLLVEILAAPGLLLVRGDQYGDGLTSTTQNPTVRYASRLHRKRKAAPDIVPVSDSDPLSTARISPGRDSVRDDAVGRVFRCVAHVREGHLRKACKISSIPLL
jgi:hypothetical protein